MKSRDGSKIFFRSEERMMVVDVEIPPELRVSPARELYSGRYRHFDPANYDLSLDGSSFVRPRPATRAGAASYLPLRLRWFDDIEETPRQVAD